MFKRFGLRTLVVSTLLVIPLVLGIALSGYGEWEGPGQDDVIGKKTAGGTFVSIQVEGLGCPFVVSFIQMTCNKTDYTVGPGINTGVTPDNIGTLLPEDLENKLIEEAGPLGCFSADGGDDIVIDKVTSFSNTGTAIIADIVIKPVL